MNWHEKKLKGYFEKNKQLMESWNKNFEAFLKSTRNKYKMHYCEEFHDFGEFIEFLLNDTIESENDKSLHNGAHDEKIDSLQEAFDSLLRRWVDQHANEKNFIEKNEGETEWLFYLRGQAITDFYNAIVNYKELLEKTYQKQLSRKNPGYVRQWMLEDPMIEPLIRKYKICEILNELEKKNSRSVKTKKPFRYLFQLDEPRYQGRYPYVCFITNQSFYNAILPELDIQKITLQKYFKAFCDVGAIKKLDGVTGANVRKNETLYAIGYLAGFEGGKNQLNRFLTEKSKKNFVKFKLS